MRPAENRDLLERATRRTDPLDQKLPLAFDRRKGPEHRVAARRPGCAERLLCAAELRYKPVRERQHLGGRAVVRLEPDDGRPRVPLRHRQQIGGSGAREPVDRLIVVAHSAELVTAAQPELEQRLL